MSDVLRSDCGVGGLQDNVLQGHNPDHGPGKRPLNFDRRNTQSQSLDNRQIPPLHYLPLAMHSCLRTDVIVEEKRPPDEERLDKVQIPTALDRDSYDI